MTLQDYETNLTQTIEALKQFPLEKLDSQTEALKEVFDIAYGFDIFKVYAIDDGFHQANARFKLFTSLTPYSGSLVFLGIQILAANNIMNAANFPLKERYFAKKSGIAINHLRAPVTVICATKSEEGYLLNGTLTWTSGYGIFDTLLIGFHYGDYEYISVAPFENSKTFKVGEAAKSFAGNAMATVNVKLNEFFIPEENIVTFSPIGSYTRGKSISKTVHIAIYSLGLGAIEQFQDKEVKHSARVRLEKIRDRFLETNDGTVMDSLRIELFGLVQEIITTGMVLYGGKSILIQEHLQRYYRELIMFNSNGLNTTIKGLFKEKFLKC